MFSTHPKKNFCVYVTFILSSANAFNLDPSKNLLFGQELNSRISKLNFFKKEKQPKLRYFKVASTITCNKVAHSVDQRSDCKFCAV